MQSQKKQDFNQDNHSCLHMINLNIEAEKIKSSYKLRSCIEALVEFVGAKKYSYTN